MSAAAGAQPSERVWIDDYTARASELWERTAQASWDVASRFGARSLEEGPWTVDTVTADLIEASDRLTPLLGEGIELWLEMLQRSVAIGARSRAQ